MLRLPRLNQRQRRIARRAFSQFTVIESHEQAGLVIGSHFTNSSAFIFAFANLRSEVPDYFLHFRAQQPTPAIDHMRADGAQSTTTLLYVRPPVPRTIRISPRVGSKSELRMSHFADLATTHEFAHLHAPWQKAQFVIDERQDPGFASALSHAPGF